MTQTGLEPGDRSERRTRRPTALVLSMHPLAAPAGAGARTIGAMPYGMERLSDEFELTWTDRQHEGLWRSRLPRLAGGATRRWAPGVQGLLGAGTALPRLRDADAVFSIFENAGLGFARVQAMSPPSRRTPHVMLACWLAEDCQQMSRGRRASVRRSLASVARIAVFSSNQVDVLRRVLEVDPGRVAVVPFGVDTTLYDATSLAGPRGGGGLVAVGSDSRRDYGTLFEAARLAGVPLTLACQPRNIAHVSVPSWVTVRHDAYGAEYRKLLMSADLVVTPTVGPAYPSGQSVVLEAMAMGRATLTTDSPAMREYVEPGVTGVLTPRGDPDVMARNIRELLADPPRLVRLGDTGAERVRARFGFEHMWQALSEVLRGAVSESPSSSKG